MSDLTQNYNTVLLMCPADYYEIPEPATDQEHANDFAIQGYKEQLKNPEGFRNQAIGQWTELRNIFSSLGVHVIELNPKPDVSDLVFTADPSLSLILTSRDCAVNSNPTAITILSHFSNEGRQSEVDATISLIEQSFPHRGIVKAHYRTEGTGDNIYDPFRDVYWSGFVEYPGRLNAASGRSDVRAHRALESVTGVPVISMAVKRPFFHIDTAMAPLTMGHILCYKDGMQPEAFDKLLREGLDQYGLPRKEYLIEVSKEEAARYGCNLVCIENTIVMAECGDDLKDRLNTKGYEVITTDMSRFIYSGGAVHCVTNKVNEQRILGGTCGQYGFGRLEL